MNTTGPGPSDDAVAPPPDDDRLSGAERTRLRRFPENGSHRRADLDAVLDAGWICHLGVVIDGWPMVVPTTYGRSGRQLYVHGSVASRSLRLGPRLPICVTVTHVDGIVVARSLFNHSVNYRSAMIFGTAEVLRGPDRLVGLRAIADQVVPGQWDYARTPSTQELAQTSVLRLDLDLASVKRSAGPPSDGDGPDGTLPVWAGHIPVRVVAGTPVAAPDLRDDVVLPAHLAELADTLAERMAPPTP